MSDESKHKDKLAETEARLREAHREDSRPGIKAGSHQCRCGYHPMFGGGSVWEPDNDPKTRFGMRFSERNQISTGSPVRVDPPLDTLVGLSPELLWEERQTEAGIPFRIQRNVMPRIPDSILGCTIYLYPSVKDAKNGEKAGGTGFLISVPSDTIEDLCHTYAVSNVHVVKDSRSPVVRLNDRQGGFDVIPIRIDDWISHPDGDDVAICPIPLSANRHAFQLIRREILLSHSVMEDFSIGLGDNIFQVGRFINHDGVQRNLPTVRCGTIAMMPHEPVKLHNGHMQECFLVEVHSKPGWSGSPVFFQPYEFRQPHIDSPLNKGVRWPLALIGVVQGYFPEVSKVLDRRGRPWMPAGERVYLDANTGMEIVIPAWRLQALIDLPKFVRQRAASDKAFAKTASLRPKPC